MNLSSTNPALPRKKWALPMVLAALAAVGLLAYHKINAPAHRDLAAHPPAPSSAPADVSSNSKTTEDRLTGVERQLERLVAKLDADTRHDPPSSEAQLSETAELRKRLDELSAQFARLESEKRLRAREGARLAAAVNDPELRQKYTAFAEDQNRMEHEHIAALFTDEPVDSAWAAEHQASIESAFNTSRALSSASLTGLDCRFSMCRLEINAQPLSPPDNPKHETELFILENELTAAVTRDLPRSHIRTTRDEAGGINCEIYLFREGYAVPRLENPLEGKTISGMIDFIQRQ